MIFLWSSVWLFLAGFLSSIFDSFSEDQANSEVLLESLPAELAEAFNIGENYLTQVETFASGQFLTLLTLVSGIFASFVGVGAVASKIEKKTIINFLSLPISRVSYFSLTSLVNVLFFAISNLIICFGLYGMFSILTEQDEISLEYFGYMFVGTFGLQLFFLTLAQLLSNFLERSKVLASVSAFVILSWFLNSLLNLASLPDFIKFALPYYYFDTTYLSQNFELDWSLLWFLFASSLILWILGLIGFAKKSVYL